MTGPGGEKPKRKFPRSIWFTDEQEVIVDCFLREAGWTLGKLKDTALGEFFERRGIRWPWTHPQDDE